jgi:hypothetical protein
MTEQKNPLEQALDLFVFAPLGFVLSANETIPELAEKGRQYVAAARMMGEFAIGQGRGQAEKAVKGAAGQADRTLSAVGLRRPEAPSTPRPPAAPTPPAGTVPPPAPEGAAARVEAATASGGTGTGNGRVTNTSPATSADSLAIPGYDTLSASQVVQRLGGLSEEELEAVRSYEESGRRRKTILSRVAQLQSGS